MNDYQLDRGKELSALIKDAKAQRDKWESVTSFAENLEGVRPSTPSTAGGSPYLRTKHIPFDAVKAICIAAYNKEIKALEEEWHEL